MKHLFLTLFLMSNVAFSSFGWGQNGHRIVGQLAEWHLSKKAKKNIEALLKGETLPMVANWMDEIRSDDRYDYATTWHYLTVEDGKGYDPYIQDTGGDAYAQLLKIIVALKNVNLSEKE